MSSLRPGVALPVLVTVVLLAITLLAASLPQDPVQVWSPPLGAEPLPPLADPPPTAVDRADLTNAFLPATGLEGFYRLSAIAIDGRILVDGIDGFLAIGRRHLSLHVVQAGPPGRPPLVQAGFRSYRFENGELITTALSGHESVGGNLRFDAPGLVERRAVVRMPTAMRIVRAEGSWMEFVRIE